MNRTSVGFAFMVEVALNNNIWTESADVDGPEVGRANHDPADFRPLNA